MSPYSNCDSSSWLKSPAMRSEVSFQTDSSPPSMQSSFISTTTNANSLSVLRDLDINARQELLESPLVLVRIAYTDITIHIPSSLISSYSPFVRARIAEAYTTYNSQPSSFADISAEEDIPAVTIPYIQAAALEYLVDYMVSSASIIDDEPMQPPTSPRNTIICYHAIRVLQMPFCEKKFQATIMDFLSKETFSKDDIEAVWIFMNGIDPKVPGGDEKIVSHMVQNVAYRTEEGKLKLDGDVWEYVRSMPELERRVKDVGDRLRNDRDGSKGKGLGLGLGCGSPETSFGF
ncbi:hypothetical protein EJ05DRAFT_481000 [Pseudovirgaria hyperparasitica]|uniref:BTB domain-containing protein n=1 Tax=Pseudovirgaria hyperparasitica TaxID=470096 RepID=A0A6A6VSA9_9PEZI|nr:uncharacterized protein EJ05DRAFT_481000 [Pseudovirgaria hyperparasitica]KAF2752759.1 hypothetical protein EJ05DRAFT_481000 [Pseudovirgaria hyperparasitica]